MSLERVSHLPDTPDAIQQLRQALAQVHAYLPQLVGDIEAQVTGHQQLAPVRDELDLLLRDLNQMVIAEAGNQRNLELEAGGKTYTVQIRSSMKRSQWRSEDLAKEIVVDGLRDGGIDEAWTALTKALPLTASMPWRVTALKELGIDPSDWCIEEPGHKSVSITGGNK